MKKLFFVSVCFLLATTLTAGDMLVNVSDDTGTCSNGGKKIEVGTDKDGSGQLEENNEFGENEISSIEYVCNGANGTATTISVTENPTLCGTAGGILVTVGLNEFPVCNGEDGKNAFVRTSEATEEEAAAHGCPNGGIKIEAGIDNTVTKTEYACNGEKGEPGKDGNNVLVKTSDAETANCKNGGVKIEIYIDTNNSGKIDDGDEIDKNQTRYICNGATGTAGASGSKGDKGEDGKDGEKGEKGDQGEKGATGEKGDQGAPGEAGAAGENGKDGTSSLVAIVDEPKGENCAAGGKKISVGLDSNRNGILDEDEIDAKNIYYICNGSNAEEEGLTSSSTGCSLNTVDDNGNLLPALFAVFAAICAFFGLKTVRR